MVDTLQTNTFWASAFGITLLSLSSLIVLGLLSWSGGKMFSYIRSRVILKQKPDVLIHLMPRTAGRDKPYPILQITVNGAKIFTMQQDGHYWESGELRIPNRRSIQFSNGRLPYQYFMQLGDFWFETELSDWSLWENDGDLLKRATFTSYLYINDRKCVLTKHQSPASVELYR